MHHAGLYQRGDCRQQFTVTVGLSLRVPRCHYTSGVYDA
jgi:hypothetical protein